MRNSECGVEVMRKHDFTNCTGTLWSTTYHNGGKRYCVFSYGPHFPLWVFVFDQEQWYGNRGKCSRTSTVHHNLTRPSGNIKWLSREQMQTLANDGYHALGKMRVLG